jgi:hypothetical protein
MIKKYYYAWDSEGGWDGTGLWIIYGPDGRPCDGFRTRAECRAMIARWRLAADPEDEPKGRPLIEVLAD